MPPDTELRAHIVRGNDGAVRLILRGELDMNGVLATERAVADAVRLADAGLVIDLAEVTFMDMFGARALLRAADEANSPAHPVVIANARPHVRRLFELITDVAHGRNLLSELVP
jgi:anti-anti-sigma factor